MNFDLNEEQVMLQDLVRRFGAEHYDPVRRLAYLREPDGFSRSHWAMLAQTGLLSFALPEAAGGFGGAPADIMVVMEALGRFVAVEPILPSVIMGMGALWQAGTVAQHDALLQRAAAGEALLSLALFEREARFGHALTRTAATADGDIWRITGAKTMVLGGSFATHHVTAAMTEGERAIRLFLVEAGAEGLEQRDYRLADGSLASDIRFTATPAQAMQGGEAALEAVLTQARLAICAELVGLMDMMLQTTLDYLKTRRQFGQPLGAFQAIQHRMADCYARVELSRSQLFRAAGTQTAGNPCPAATTGAKAYISESAMHVGEEAVQLHGGIGTTEELLVGQAFKRVLLLASLLGDADTEITSYARMTRETAMTAP